MDCLPLHYVYVWAWIHTWLIKFFSNHLMNRILCAVIQVDPEELVVNTALLQLAGYTPPAQPYHPPSIQALPDHDKQAYDCIVKCMEHLAVYLKYCGNANNSMAGSRLSRPMQRKLVMLLQCAVTDEEGRGRAARAARSLGERTVTELILQHQVLVMFVVQRLEPHFPQASKTSIGHVVQLLYRASCFKVSKRECDSSLMQLKEEFRTYESLRREHDAQIVQIATEAGLRIAPDQWSALLYGDTAHKSHMQSIIDKLQTPQSFAQSVQELFIALQRTGDPAQLIVMSLHLDRLANIDASPGQGSPQTAASTPTHNKYKVSMCRDAATRSFCPRGNSCTFAHSEEEMERFRINGNFPYPMMPNQTLLPNQPIPMPGPTMPIAAPGVQYPPFPMPQPHLEGHFNVQPGMPTELLPEYRVNANTYGPRPDAVWAPNPGEMFNFGDMRAALPSAPPLAPEQVFTPARSSVILPLVRSRRSSPVDGAGPRAVGGPVSGPGTIPCPAPPEPFAAPAPVPTVTNGPTASQTVAASRLAVGANRLPRDRSTVADRLSAAAKAYQATGSDDVSTPDENTNDM
ncbi:hypothetical protein HF086_000748 [Spodoptera exigua]|uniref:RING-type E3 ubiquitin transferase n=1 Tax=Spodoptera exigua TaxID=7107 RepID=A0A922M5B9_SPOEX|nr:hypothetical protein HF086_000748 [Spodoptera exigua]